MGVKLIDITVHITLLQGFLRRNALNSFSSYNNIDHVHMTMKLIRINLYLRSSRNMSMFHGLNELPEKHTGQLLCLILFKDFTNKCVYVLYVDIIMYRMCCMYTYGPYMITDVLKTVSI